MRFVRLAVHAIIGALICAGTMGFLLRVTHLGLAITLHMIAAPLIFSLVSWHYFRKPNALSLIPVASTFTGTVVVVDLLGVDLAHQSHVFGLAGMWIGLLLIFVSTCVTNVLLSTQPWKKDVHRLRRRA